MVKLELKADKHENRILVSQLVNFVVYLFEASYLLILYIIKRLCLFFFCVIFSPGFHSGSSVYSYRQSSDEGKYFVDSIVSINFEFLI